MKDRLSAYADGRNHPDDDAASGLSPWLHFGHISVHEVFQKLAEHESWNPDQLGDSRDTRGSRSGWWGMSESAESFLDELVTWRELGFNMCWQCDNYDQYESLPDWARKTLEQHAGDARPTIYSLDELTHGQTHDHLWNAAQNQLVQEGRMHNYLRM
ncbi:MAG: deoxyribodipyrimidine photolyase, partial [Planctomycetaceae bacterium]|nr:deoxyribodipyrimidine photolyase [Planctomycetaceae bacterium]